MAPTSESCSTNLRAYRKNVVLVIPIHQQHGIFILRILLHVKCLVTGGAGFIGSHLCEELINEGYEVTAVDNLSVGRLSNISHLQNCAKFRFIDLDITVNEEVESLELDYDLIFHLAALADIVPSIESPSHYVSVNVMGTLNILELVRKCNPKKFIYAASSSCYGIAKELPTSEGAEVSTEYPYAISKYIGELMALHWAQVYKLNVISLRLFNVYGPRARTSGTYGAVFGVFLAQKLAGKPLTIVGDGNQTRDFTYVSDVVDAFICAAKSDCSSEIFNVGSGGTYSINELVNLLGCKSISIPKRPGEPESTFADISKIKRILKWEPKVTFAKGVSKVIENISLWNDSPLWDPLSIEEATRSWFQYLGKQKDE